MGKKRTLHGKTEDWLPLCDIRCFVEHLDRISTDEQSCTYCFVEHLDRVSTDEQSSGGL